MKKYVFSGIIALACYPLPWFLAGPQGTATPRQPPVELKAAGIADLPDGFSQKVIATGITGATAMAIAPDGRVFVCEQTGALRVIEDDTLLAEPFLTVKVDSAWERGLLGVALDQDFPKEPYIYICYVAADPYPHHVISRFTARGDTAVPGSEVVLLKGDDQRKLGGHRTDGHQGGAVHFGKDGKLYIAIGDQTAGEPAQQLDTFRGKLLRINKDGSIPEDNPFFKTAKAKYRAIWALGLRNPFAFAVQPGSGRIFINDVGEARWEEINNGVTGGNYGWPHIEGPVPHPKYRGPVHAYDRGVGRSITGGAFYNPPVAQFPKEYVGKYFFADFMDNWIRILDPDRPKDVKHFATGLAGPVDLQIGLDGSLYYLNRNAWVKDDKFKPRTGSVHRIIYPANSKVPAPLLNGQPDDQTMAVGKRVAFTVATKGETPLRYQWLRNGQPMTGANGSVLSFTVTQADDGTEFRCLVSNACGIVKSRPAALWTTPLPKLPDTLRIGLNPTELPRRLSETGLFRSLKDLTPEVGVRPYDVNAPLWSDGTQKQRWIVLPKDAPIDFAPRGSWRFPPGTVFVKHFEMPEGEGKSARRLETRLLVVDRRSFGYGVTYQWRADGTDAELLADGRTEEYDLGGRKQAWTYPSRTDCLVCHTANAGFVLGANTRQLNHPTTKKDTDNLLLAWNRDGLFRPAIRETDIARFDRLAAVTDGRASLEHRVRSYLDSNCAQCHRPGGTRGDFDARFETLLARQKLINVPPTSSDLGVPGVRLVAPGDPAHSMLYLRIARRQDVFNMPPLATREVDRQALSAVEQWIVSLRENKKSPRDRTPK